MNAPVSVVNTKLDSNAIAYAMARNECGAKLPLADVLLAIGVDRATPGLRNLLESATFKTRFAEYVRELTESGESFRMKSRIQAEELLKVHWEIINDKTAPANVRMDGIKSVVEWGDLKPKKKEDGGNAPPAVQIYIDLGGDKPEMIDVTPAPALDAPKGG